jgi:hypothetical protein
MWGHGLRLWLSVQSNSAVPCPTVVRQYCSGSNEKDIEYTYVRMEVQVNRGNYERMEGRRKNQPFKDEAQTALFKAPVRTAL